MDTIAAIATAQSPSAIGIVRLAVAKLRGTSERWQRRNSLSLSEKATQITT